MPIESNRLTTCLLPSCARLFAVCRGCDRRRGYCSDECARVARRERQSLAGRRYQATDRGRRAHAVRQARYRERLKCVTHQSPRGERKIAEFEVIPPKLPMRAAGRQAVRGRPAPASHAVEMIRNHRPPRCAVCGREMAFLRQCVLRDLRARQRRKRARAARPEGGSPAQRGTTKSPAGEPPRPVATAQVRLLAAVVGACRRER
jgi:hypothetical protein